MKRGTTGVLGALAAGEVLLEDRGGIAGAGRADIAGDGGMLRGVGPASLPHGATGASAADRLTSALSAADALL